MTKRSARKDVLIDSVEKSFSSLNGLRVVLIGGSVHVQFICRELNQETVVSFCRNFSKVESKVNHFSHLSGPISTGLVEMITQILTR